MIYNLLLIWFGLSLAIMFTLLLACYGLAKAKAEAESKNVIYESALEIKRNTERR